MRFLSLHAKNFLSVGDAFYSLEDQGLVLVNGDNRDVDCASSNGAGKSNLFTEALTWCLFGVTTKGLFADGVLPQPDGRECSVCTQLSAEGKQLAVTRYRKHSEGRSSLSILVDGQDVSRTTVAATEKLLGQILGVDRQTFLYTTVLGQGLLYRFSQLTDQTRKEVLESIARLEVFEHARKAARKALQELKMVQEGQGGRFQEVLRQLNDLEPRLVCARSEAAQAQAKRASLVEATKSKRQSMDAQILRVQADSASKRQQHVELTQVHARLLDVADKAVATLKQHEATYASACGMVHAADQALANLTHVSGGRCYVCNSFLDEAALVALRDERTRSREVADRGAREKGAIRLSAEITADRARQAATTYRSRIDVLGKELTLLTREEQTLTTSRGNIEQYLQSLAEPTPDDRVVEELAATQTALQKQKAVLGGDLVATQKQVQAMEFWVTGFQDIRAKVLGASLSYLNARIHHYCEVLTEGEITAQLLQDESGKINLGVTTRGGSYGSASGGEKDRIDIAVAFALHDLATAQTSYQSNVLVLDEPAVFVDAAGIRRLMDLVAEKMERVSTCFLTTQNPVFRGYCDKVWTVVKEKGVSRLEM